MICVSTFLLKHAFLFSYARELSLKIFLSSEKFQKWFMLRVHISSRNNLGAKTKFIVIDCKVLSMHNKGKQR